MEEQIIKNVTEKPGIFKKGRTPWNKGKINPNRQTKKEEYKKHEKKYWERNIKKRFGINLEEYDKLLKEQNGICAICRKKPTMILSVDHNHKTGKVRGLLCYNCNVGIGMFRENISLMKKGIKYLEKHNG